jgi:hypothetical protein
MLQVMNLFFKEVKTIEMLALVMNLQQVMLQVMILLVWLQAI